MVRLLKVVIVAASVASIMAAVILGVQFARVLS